MRAGIHPKPKGLGFLPGFLVKLHLTLMVHLKCLCRLLSYRHVVDEVS